MIRYLAIGWLIFCAATMSFLVLTDHWLAFAVALSPLPSLLGPLSLGWLILLAFISRRDIPWAVGALLASLVLTPFEIGTWEGERSAATATSADSRPAASARPRGSTELTLISVNLGGRDRAPLLDFVHAMQPDIVATQARALPYNDQSLAQYERVYVDGFSLWSRWPIVDRERIRIDEFDLAARFEVAWGPSPLVIYVTHFPTPRYMLGDLRGRGLLQPENWEESAEFQRRKWRLLEGLLERVEAERVPTLLVGDMNQPACGPAYRRLTTRLEDGHRRAGWGRGYTIPGSVNSPWIQPLCPWARIDYILADRQWEFLEHFTEPRNRGKHQAVFARLRLP